MLHVLADGCFLNYVYTCVDPAKVAWQITQSQCRSAQGVWDAAASLCRNPPQDCLLWVKFYQGGLAYYGGLIGGAGAAVWIARRDKLPVLKVSDLTFMGVSMGLFFGRIGCFLGGCCYGLVTDHALGTRFPKWSPASEGQFREGLLAHPSMESLPVHPTQLYEAVGCLLISVFLSYWGPRHKRFDGHVSLAFLSLYAILRFVIELYRADDRGLWLGVSTSQWISIVILAMCSALFIQGRRSTRMALASVTPAE